jgi:hypothetical protein
VSRSTATRCTRSASGSARRAAAPSAGQLRKLLFGLQRRGRRLRARIFSTAREPFAEDLVINSAKLGKLVFGCGKLADDLVQAIGWAGRHLGLALCRGELIDAGGQFGSHGRQRRAWDNRFRFGHGREGSDSSFTGGPWRASRYGKGPSGKMAAVIAKSCRTIVLRIGRSAHSDGRFGS